MSYDPVDPVYWDAAALQQEIERVFEVCHGCRMCFKYCDSFPTLFSLLDDVHDGDVRKVTAEETHTVMDHCFQCKLCEVQCPYTPRDNHEFQLDFPKLVHRYVAQQKKKTGFTLQERVLGDPDFAGKSARASLGVINTLNRVGLHRYFFEKVVGVDRRKELPHFASESFSAWAQKENRIAPPSDKEAVLFQTCYVEHNEPDIGKDTLTVLEKNEVTCDCTDKAVCCGMPAWEHGDLEGLRKRAKKNIDALLPYVRNGQKVLAINPTCAMMLRREYPELVAEEDRENAQQLAEAVMDPSEFIWSLRKEERFNTDFKSSPGTNVAYHAPCHLRAQAKGFRGRDLIKKIPGVRANTVMECCGHDGTFAMTTKGYEASQRIGKKSFDEMKDADAEMWVTDCPLAATQFGQHAGRRPIHPMTLLARAYQHDGLPHPVPEEPS